MTCESLPTIPPYIKKGVYEWRRRVEYRFLYLACEQDCVVDVPSVYHHPWMHDTNRYQSDPRDTCDTDRLGSLLHVVWTFP